MVVIRHGRLPNLLVMRLDHGFFLLTVVCCGNREGFSEHAMPSANLDGCLALNASSQEVAQFFSGEAVYAVAHAEHKAFLRRSEL